LYLQVRGGTTVAKKNLPPKMSTSFFGVNYDT